MAAAPNLVLHTVLLDGRCVDSSDILRVANPARPAEPAGLTDQATPGQHEEAVQAAVVEDMTEIRILVVAQPG